MKAYMANLNKARAASGNKDYVTLKEFKSVFTTIVWKKQLQDENSTTLRFMKNYCGSHEVDEPAFDYVALVCMGLVHCRDVESKPKEKAMALFNILQDVDAEGNTAT